MFRSPRNRRSATAEERRPVDRSAVEQMRRLFGFVRPYRRYLAFAMVGVLFASALGLVFPAIIGDLVDSAVGDLSDTAELDQIALLLLVVFAVQSVFNFIRSYFVSIAGEGVVADLRKAVYAQVMTLPVRFFDARKTGEITSRLTSDVAVVQASVSQAVTQTLAQGVTLIGGVILMFVMSVRLSLTVLAILPITIVAASIFGRRLRRLSSDFQDQIADANAFAEESISANRVIKWFTAEEREVQRYGSAVDSSYAIARRRAGWRAIFISVVTFVGFGTLALVIWSGGREVLKGTLQPGELVTFLLYTLTVAGAIGAFTGLYSQLQQALGASERIFDLLDEESEIKDPADPKPLASVEGSLSFHDVSFSYGDRDLTVLHSVSLQVAPGERLAVVGPSGGGKSTLIQLVPRFFDPSSGYIAVDGEDIRSFRVAELRSHIAAVPQETQLFSGTIADNLRVGNPTATMDEIKSAAHAAHAEEFIVEFPDGYETVVGERGVKLSGGQRQRVAIARALLKDPRILVLDEATSSLDSESEGVVQQALEELMKGRTTLVIAHRLSTIRDADRIVVIDHGRIVEQGTHEGLLEEGGLYASLHAAQFEGSI